MYISLAYLNVQIKKLFKDSKVLAYSFKCFEISYTFNSIDLFQYFYKGLNVQSINIKYL